MSACGLLLYADIDRVDDSTCVEGGDHWPPGSHKEVVRVDAIAERVADMP
jgi:hypothetical protein